MNIRNMTLGLLGSVAVASAPAVAQNPANMADNTPITISGTVVSSTC